ncbi:MAG: metallophosphoesterase family protein, partial [Myxococcales bacterium]
MWPATALALNLERGPYLQMGTSTSMIVRWRTDTASESHISFGVCPDATSDSITLPGPTTEHEIEIFGLDPFTQYCYAVGTTSLTLAGGDTDHYFVTSPVPGTRQPIRIWVVGDSGLPGAIVQSVRDAYLDFAGSRRADAWLMLGDNAYETGTDAEYTTAVFQTFTEILRNTVVWPAPGNHSFGASDSPTQSGPYYEAFTVPTLAEAGGVASGTEAYYSYDYGNVHLVSLDSHDTSRTAPSNPTTNICPPLEGGAMYQWLCADLAATDKDWIIVYWHHPPYTKGSHDSDTESQLVEMRERFVPVLEHFGVDLQLAGHSHSYERSMLIDGHYGQSSTFNSLSHAVDDGDGDPSGDGSYQKFGGPHGGTVYSVVGSSAKSGGGGLDHPVMVISLSDNGSMVVDIDLDRLDARWIESNGAIRDHFQIVKPLISTTTTTSSTSTTTSTSSTTTSTSLPVTTTSTSAT